MIHDNPVFIRLMSWNLLEGGHDSSHGAGWLDHKRMEAARALVAEVDPHVLVLNEALWCEPHAGYRADYAGLFNLEHSAARLYDGYWGNAILSRYPIVECRPMDIHNRGGLVAMLETPAGIVQVATYHPHPSRWPHHKAQDYQALLDLCRTDLPLVICGDFNAISPQDHPDHDALTAEFSVFSQHPRQDSARFIEGGQAIFPVLQAHGLRDAIIEKHPSMPTALVRAPEQGGMRIDHAWINQHWRATASQVLHHRLADAASDHYPLVLDLAVVG